MSKYIIFFAISLISSWVSATERSDIAWHNKEIVVRGDYLRAAIVAERDFSARLIDKKNRSIKADEGADQDLNKYLSQIENYNIEIGFGKGKYFIWIAPRLSEHFPAIFGGDALYTVDDKTFQLLDKQYGK